MSSASTTWSSREEDTGSDCEDDACHYQAEGVDDEEETRDALCILGKNVGL